MVNIHSSSRVGLLTNCNQSQLLILMISMMVMMLVRPTVATVAVTGNRLDSQRQCEPIRIETCKGLGYNQTGMPNLVGHEIQQDAELQFQTFMPLVQYGCSSQLKFFLCSVYVPMCTEKVPETIGPCRPLCESVKSRCQPVLSEFGFAWPAALNCSKFPAVNDHEHMCMEGPKESVPEWPQQPSPAVPNSHPINTNVFGGGVDESVLGSGNLNGVDNNDRVIGGSSSGETHVSGGGAGRRPKPTGSRRLRPGGRGRGHKQPASFVPASVHARQHFGLCSNYKFAEEYYWINQTERCAHRCSADILFSHDNKEFAQLWSTIWSVIAAISCVFTVVSFAAEPKRVHYSDRVIAYMASAYLVYSLAFFVRLAAGRDAVACHRDAQHGVDILIQEGLDNAYCTTVFVLLYYFSMAAMIWWAVLCFTWFLSTGMSASSETIERWCSYFHVAAWGLPGLKVRPLDTKISQQ